MQQTEKNKPQKYTNGPSPSWSAKYQTNVRDSSDTNWKYNSNHKHNSYVPSNKVNRNQFNATAEPITSYYSTTNCYKQPKDHNSESRTYTKYTTFQNTEPHRWSSYNRNKTPRNKLYTINNNVAIVRKPIYNRNELEDDGNLRYGEEELGNFTEDNIEDDAIEEEVDEDQEETADSGDKDYEEHETDDEIDEESDSTVLRSQQLQRRPKKDRLSQEQQRLRIIKQQQHDPRKVRYQQYSQNSYNSHPSRIRYHQDFNDRNDATELYADEESVRPPTPPKNSIRKLGTNHHHHHHHHQQQQQKHWTLSRNSSDRYDNVPILNQTIRRSQPKQDIEGLSHLDNKNIKKCIRCGAPSGNKFSIKNKKNICRFQEHPDFIVKDSFGDDMDTVDKILCGSCNVKHNSDDIDDINRSTRSTMQTLKPRRSKGSKGITDISENFPIIEDVTNDYMINRYSRDHHPSSANAVNERTKHSAQTTTRGQTRSFSRYGT